MGVLRSLGVGLLVILLAVDLAVANAAIGLDRTVLSPEFVTETLAEEDVYENLLSVTTEQMTALNESSNDSADQFPVSPEVVVAKAVPPDYLQGQVEANVERNLAYLHGNRDEPEIAVDLRPVKANVTTVVESELQNVTITELFGSFAGGDATAASGTFSMGLLARMAENESAYQEARTEFRADLRARVVDEFVAQQFEEATNDELLALVIDDYDPDAYSESEKAQMVEDREGEIRATIRETVEAEAGEEIDAELSERLSTYREEFKSQTEGEIETNSGEMGPELSEAFVDVAMVGIDGLTTEMTYQKYRSQLDEAKDRLASAIAGQVGKEIDANVPDRMDLTEEMDQGELDGLATARTAVQAIDLLAIGLPVLAVLLVGGLWWLTRSTVTTTLAPGVVALVVGGSSFATASLAPGLLRENLPAETTSEQGMGMALDIGLAIVDQVFAAFALQSGVLAGVGLVLVGVAITFKFGMVTTEMFRGLVGR